MYVLHSYDLGDDVIFPVDMRMAGMRPVQGELAELWRRDPLPEDDEDMAAELRKIGAWGAGAVPGPLWPLGAAPQVGRKGAFTLHPPQGRWAGVVIRPAQAGLAACTSGAGAAGCDAAQRGRCSRHDVPCNPVCPFGLLECCMECSVRSPRLMWVQG